MSTNVKNAKIISLKKIKRNKKKRYNTKIINLENPFNLQESNNDLKNAGFSDEMIYTINPKLNWNQVFEKLNNGSKSWYDLAAIELRELMEKYFETPTLKL